MTRILLIGESWGMKESLFEHAFVGPSGVELARMLGEAELAPAPEFDHPSELEMIKHWKLLRKEADIEIANVFNYHPLDNKVELCFTSRQEGRVDLPPYKKTKFVRPEFYSHLETLWRTIDALKPNLIIALGNTACWAVLGEDKISALRGTVKTSPKFGIKVLPTYHPSAVLHQWNLRTIVLTDLQKAAREADFTDIKRIERWLTIEPTLEEIAEWFRRPASYYAVDIETSIKPENANKPIPMKQITMIGFARSAFDALVIPFADPSKPGWSYWPTIAAEMSAWRFVEQGLKSPIPKLFQNGVFDLSYILMAGLRPEMCQDDTMLLHHALYPEMLKGLGFLGSVYSEEIAWKTMRTKGDNLKRDE